MNFQRHKAALRVIEYQLRPLWTMLRAKPNKSARAEIRKRIKELERLALEAALSTNPMSLVTRKAGR